MSSKNARSSSVAETIPSFPVASIEFDVLQEQLRSGKTGEEALEAAIVRRDAPAEPPAPVAEIEDPAPEAPAEPPVAEAP